MAHPSARATAVNQALGGVATYSYQGSTDGAAQPLWADLAASGWGGWALAGERRSSACLVVGLAEPRRDLVVDVVRVCEVDGMCAHAGHGSEALGRRRPGEVQPVGEGDDLLVGRTQGGLRSGVLLGEEVLVPDRTGLKA